MGHWLRRNYVLKDALERMVSGKIARGRKRYQMIYNIMICGLYEDKKRKAEKRRVETAEFAMKDLPLDRTLWLIDFPYAAVHPTCYLQASRSSLMFPNIKSVSTGHEELMKNHESHEFNSLEICRNPV